MEIFGKWRHSFEEDEGGLTVYRPSDFDFPRARGRAGIEICADGSFIDWTIGRGDSEASERGQWSTEHGSDMNISFASGKGRDRVIEIIECSSTILRTRIKTSH